ncbi:MAG: dihydrodipicolinate synthase family protein [Caldilineaceae bacterium SB0668_bin_21]|nr:dihydrodipicolinate synthase family protein [Caldilineaceae bacterium SB0668_bin_21]MYC21035.1 dihydrodipicolinate synthase family protein [Caldilineaceae bacterium SB0662_bin_25]
MTELSLRGVFAPTLTPILADLSIDIPAYTEFCHRLLQGGCHGLVLFGTNSEATSFSASERMAAVDAVIESGVAPDRLVVGSGSASVVEAAELTRHAVESGCRGVLTLPPFYYPGVSDEGLFRSFAAVLDRVNDERLRMYFYHIPQVSGIPLSPSLLDRLADAYPRQAAGVKDSSGDVVTLMGLHGVAAAHPGFSVFCGTEALLLKNLQGGGGGCISGMANVLPHVIRDLYDNWEADDAEERQNRTNWIRDAILESGFNMIASLKVIVGDQTGRPGWSRVRPPLVDLTETEQEQLLARLSPPVPA